MNSAMITAAGTGAASTVTRGAASSRSGGAATFQDELDTQSQQLRAPAPADRAAANPPARPSDAAGAGRPADRSDAAHTDRTRTGGRAHPARRQDDATATDTTSTGTAAEPTPLTPVVPTVDPSAATPAPPAVDPSAGIPPLVQTGTPGPDGAIGTVTAPAVAGGPRLPAAPVGGRVLGGAPNPSAGRPRVAAPPHEAPGLTLQAAPAAQPASDPATMSARAAAPVQTAAPSPTAVPAQGEVPAQAAVAADAAVAAQSAVPTPAAIPAQAAGASSAPTPRPAESGSTAAEPTPPVPVGALPAGLRIRHLTATVPTGQDTPASPAPSSTPSNPTPAVAGVQATPLQPVAQVAPVAPAGPAEPTLAAQLTPPIAALAARGNGEHVVTVRVTPENLGAVTVRAHVVDGAMRVELFATEPHGRDALAAMLPDLRRDLATGSGTGSTTVGLGTGDTGQGGARGSGSDRGTGAPAWARDDAPAPTVSSPRSPWRAAPGSGRLDVLA